MAQGRTLSKLVTAGLITCVSCFPITGDPTILKFHSANNGVAAPLAETEIQRLVRPALAVKGGQHASSTILHAKPKESLGSEVITRQMAASYSLLWSPGFMSKFSISTTALLILHLTGTARRIGLLAAWGLNSHVLGPMHGALSGTFPNFFLPLLSSSCCLLQLLINALVGAGGCAGFNTVLGPVRPVFLSLLAYLNWTSRPSLPKAALRLSLALLPEIVDLWNRWLAHSWKQRFDKEIVDADTFTATVEIEIPTMGCVACINKIDNSLRNSAPANVIEATSWLDATKEKGGRATVRVAAKSQEQLNAINDGLLKSINEAGFSGSQVIACRADDKEETK